MLIKTAIQLLCSLVFVFGQTLASAETDLLNLATYAEDTRVPYGENMVVIQNEKTAEKSLTPIAGSKGKLDIPINLNGNSFEINFEIYGGRPSAAFALIADEVTFSFSAGYYGSGISLEGNQGSPPVWQKDGKNLIKVLVSNGVAKLYANDAFVQKVTINEKKLNVTYTKLSVTNIGGGYRLYSLKIKGGSDVPAPSGTTTPANGDCMATYTGDGKIHIPCLSVPNAFGGTNVYDIQMQQQPGKMTFDVDMNSIKPR